MQENILMAKRNTNCCPSVQVTSLLVRTLLILFPSSLSLSPLSFPLSPVHNNNGPLSAQEIFDATTISSQHISFDSKIQKQIYTWTKTRPLTALPARAQSLI